MYAGDSHLACMELAAHTVVDCRGRRGLNLRLEPALILPLT